MWPGFATEFVLNCRYLMMLFRAVYFRHDVALLVYDAKCA